MRYLILAIAYLRTAVIDNFLVGLLGRPAPSEMFRPLGLDEATRRDIELVKTFKERVITMANDLPVLYRQGDILVRRISTDPEAELPRETRPVERDEGRVILAYGEVTGHAHVLLEPEVELFEAVPTTADDRRAAAETATEVDRWLRQRNPNGATITHEEHGGFVIAPGTYEIIRQREHTQEDRAAYVRD
jgi:hypothetical protein|tara:strand:- start:2813 stop:3382 length:570 start_codon:yes stop_codon:yes gene_type:complete